MIADALTPGALVILESTTYPGTTERARAADPGAHGPPGRAGDFHLGYSPERIDPGNPTWGLVNTPKVVSGVDEASRVAVERFFGALVDKVVPVATTAEAELVKLLENTFRHVNIALVNELAMFASDLGVDVWRAIDAASTKPFGYMRFTPGPGVGGHCLPIDPSFLSWRVKQQPRSHVPLRRAGQRRQRAHAGLRRDEGHHVCSTATVAPVRGTRVLVLGLSYKAGTADWRESPALGVVQRLLGLGAEVRAWEPHVAPVGRVQLPVPVVECDVAEIEAADLVVILVDHPGMPVDDVAEHATLVLDTRGVLRDHTFRGELL